MKYKMLTVVAYCIFFSDMVLLGFFSMIYVLYNAAQIAHEIENGQKWLDFVLKLMFQG
jgi:hypothetical protein